MPKASLGPETPERLRHEASVRRALRAAVKATTAATEAAGVWADTVRQGTETRVDIGPLDERALEDGEFSGALARFGELRRLKEEAERQLEAWETQNHG